ncbi:uncharacterized protein LOC142980853 [Anticarsia gemmatalis]|uniref:uncharacterized protein LOC142980853 n=1 Tax=Anticarsia gemmatalis TaxID=129554 RepID=UPI003F761DD1
MSDEIDIEEHDVLDNPNIKRIFPDLSIIKQEISQYEAGLVTNFENTVAQAVDDLNEDPNATTTMPQNEKDQTSVHTTFKQFLASLVDEERENSDNNLSTTSCADTESDTITSSSFSLPSTTDNRVKRLRQNVFIIGSKPCVKQTKRTKEKTQIKIVLDDISDYLHSCRQYCEQCYILFPSVDRLESHMNKIHSNTSSVFTKKSSVGLKSPGSKFRCEICTINLSCKGNLTRHIKMVHNKPGIPQNVPNKTRKSLRESQQNIQTTKPAIEDTKAKLPKHNCFHCEKVFETRNALIEHIYEVLNATKTNEENNQKSKKCDDIDKSNVENKSISLETKKSKERVPSQMELDEHKSKNHSEDINNQNKEKVTQKRLSAPLVNRNRSESVETVKDKPEANKQREARQQSRGKSETSEESNSETEYDDNISADVDEDFTMSKSKVKQKNGTVKNTNGNLHKKHQCYICSQYMHFYKPYTAHMLKNHNIKEYYDDVIKILDFDPQCKFCDKKMPCIQSYNQHVSKMHQEKWKQEIEVSVEALESIIFKCLKCGVFFLNSHTAINHSQHQHILGDWRCVQCKKMFKVKDKILHMKQHSLTRNITAYELCEFVLNRVLYKCLKCAVHFTEKEYFVHNQTCDVNVPNSSYCNACDILIYATDMDKHEQYHQGKKLQALDFILIESEIIKNEENKRRALAKDAFTTSNFALTYCAGCNCFVGDLSGNARAHIEKRCSQINSRICRKCGLIFTSKGYVSHELLHDKVKNLNLQTYYFYDIQTKKQMLPPIPKYPKCEICEVHFLSNQAIKQHVCFQQEHVECNVCKAKLTEAAYKLHINYHNYKLSSSALTKQQNAQIKLKEIEVKSNKANDGGSKSNNIQNVNGVTEIVNPNRTNYVFTCTVCLSSVGTYDEVVLHCQYHYDSKKEKQSSDDKQNKISDTCNDHPSLRIKFDPFYFRFNNELWQNHIFVNLNQDNIKNILENSVYQYECRLKMEEIQTGPSSMTLYKCDFCRAYVNPTALFSHAQGISKTKKRFPCSVCGLCFSSPSYRSTHEKVHETSDLNIKSYRIVIFNKTEHNDYNKIMLNAQSRFILYQCRNCNEAVEQFERDKHQCRDSNLKECSSCGLLFNRDDYDAHVTKHKEITLFKPERIKVVMFNKVDKSDQNENKLRPSFSGTVVDLSFYKCSSCELCVLSESGTTNHVCVAKYLKIRCLYCNLSFAKQDMPEHLKLHENYFDLDYDDFKSNVIPFIAPAEAVSLKRKEESAATQCNNPNKKICLNITQTLYKCKCGLHFLEQINAEKHYNSCYPKMKISKQNCFKCDLLFTPGELFDHLLKHHSNKKVPFKYAIVNVAAKKIKK